MTLDDAIESGAVWLEDTGRYARYWTNPNDDTDGESDWFCTRCGALVDPDEGCEECDDE